MNPLLDFSGLPRFAEIKPSTSRPRSSSCSPTAARPTAAGAERRADLGRVRRAARGRERAPRPRLGPGRAPERGDGQPGAARGLQRQPAEGHAVLDRARPERGAVREVQGAARLARVRQPRAGAEEDRRQRAARLPPRRRRAAARQEGATPRSRRSWRAVGASSPRTCSTRPTPFRSTSTRTQTSPAFPTTCSKPRARRRRRTARTGWKFTLHVPSYLPVMQYADDRALRETMYRASSDARLRVRQDASGTTRRSSRASCRCGARSRELLGYRDYAEVSLVPKMAESPSQVLAFLDDLARRARPFAERTGRADRVRARRAGPRRARSLGRRLRLREAARQALRVLRPGSEAVLPEDEVLAGLFRVVETLYGVKIVAGEGAGLASGRALLRRHATRAGTLIGQFYLDLYAREAKRGGAWMDDAITRRRKRGQLQIPVAYLNCNFSPPVGGKPALFTHDEVMTLFHEFGHGLHHLLTRVEDLGVSGINGVEWDAVELPSQFMENFCWEWDVLRDDDARTSTPASRCPRALFDKMLAAKNFQSGLAMLRQLEFALFDMRLHYDFDPAARQQRARAARGSARAGRGAACRRRTTASRTASRTSSPAATPPATTATSGPRCCRPTPTACSRRTACSTRRPARASATRSSRSAAAARRWSRSSRSAAASRTSTRCCATTA